MADGLNLKTKIEVDEFFDRYKGVMPERIFEKIQIFTLGIENSVFISDRQMSILKKKLQERQLSDELLQTTATNNNAGIAAEKAGDIQKAISYYEANLKIDYPAYHSYDRLMIIYRKLKRYEDEIRVIDAAISLLSKRNGLRPDNSLIKYKKRKGKATSLLINNK